VSHETNTVTATQVDGRGHRPDRRDLTRRGGRSHPRVRSGDRARWHNGAHAPQVSQRRGQDPVPTRAYRARDFQQRCDPPAVDLTSPQEGTRCLVIQVEEVVFNAGIKQSINARGPRPVRLAY
jgi:hypothetical protein